MSLFQAAPATGAQRTELTFLVPSLAGGGAERVMMDLAMEAAAGGRRVDVVVINSVGATVDDLGPGVRIVDLNRTRAATSLPAFVRYLRRSRPVAVMSTLEHTNVLALIGARIVPGSRVVVREANTFGVDAPVNSYKRKVLHQMMRWTYGSAEAVVAVSEGVAESLVRDLGLAPDKIRVILNPVITPRIFEGAQEPADHPWFVDDGAPVILGVGRLAEQKGFDTLLRSFAEARRQSPMRLLILGEGPLRSELAGLANQLGLSEHVDMPGFVANPFAYMARCDLFVLSSRWEGLPNVLIQAMALGAKAVATDCPSGPREATEGGRLAPLVPVDDVDALAQAIVEGLRTPVKTPGPAWFERYSLTSIASKYLSLLDGEPSGA